MLLWLVATQARADLTLTIQDNPTGDKIKIVDHGGVLKSTISGNPANVTTTSLTGTASSFHFIGTIDGYKFDVTTSTTLPGSPGVNKVAGSFVVTGTSTAAKTTFSYSVNDSPFPVVPGLKMKASAFSGSGFPSGGSVGVKARYSAYTSGFVLTNAGSTGMATLTGPNQSVHSGLVSLVPAGGSKYALSGLGGVLNLGSHPAGATAKFYSQATTAVPEATGWLAALLALPCAAMVVVLGKRRKTAGLNPVV